MTSSIEQDIRELRKAVHEQDIQINKLAGALTWWTTDREDDTTELKANFGKVNEAHIRADETLKNVKNELTRLEQMISSSSRSLKEDIEKLEKLIDSMNRAKWGVLSAVLIALLTGAANVIVALLD